MQNIEDLLKRGFGLVTINELISLSYHDNILIVNFEPLPGMIKPVQRPLASRTVEDIKAEIYDYLHQYIICYHGIMSYDLTKM